MNGTVDAAGDVEPCDCMDATVEPPEVIFPFAMYIVVVLLSYR